MVTQHGIERGVATWQPDFSATRDRDGKWSATHSFRCYLDDVPLLMPTQGAACQEPGYGFLGFEAATIKNIQGMVGEVTCTFVGSTENDFDFDESEYTVTISTSTSEEPLETHPRYKDLFYNGDTPKVSLELDCLQHIKSGRTKFVEEIGGIQGVFQFRDQSNSNQIVILEGELYELAKFFYKGTTHYLASNQIARVRYVKKTRPTDQEYATVGYKAGVPGGKRLPPKVPDAPDDRDWLFVGFSVTNEGSVYIIEEEYMLSGLGGWEKLIYEK